EAHGPQGVQEPPWVMVVGLVVAADRPLGDVPGEGLVGHAEPGGDAAIRLGRVLQLRAPGVTDEVRLPDATHAAAGAIAAVAVVGLDEVLVVIAGVHVSEYVRAGEDEIGAYEALHHQRRRGHGEEL